MSILIFLRKFATAGAAIGRRFTTRCCACHHANRQTSFANRIGSSQRRIKVFSVLLPQSQVAVQKNSSVAAASIFWISAKARLRVKPSGEMSTFR